MEPHDVGNRGVENPGDAGHEEEHGGESLEEIRAENTLLKEENRTLHDRANNLDGQNKALTTKVRILGKKAETKEELVSQNINLVNKNKRLKATNTLKSLELVDLKITAEKYKGLMRKFGSEEQQKKNAETRDEIMDSLASDLKDCLISFNRNYFSDIECQNFGILIFLEMCGSSQLNFITKLLKFTSPGIRSATGNVIKNHFESKKPEFNIRELAGNEAAVANESTPRQSGISGILQMATVQRKAKEFDESNFLSDENQNCSFVEEELITYISLVGNENRLIKNKKAGQAYCQLPTCSVPFTLGVTLIGPVKIAAPNTAPGFGRVLWVCKKHIMASINGIRVEKSNVVKKLFGDSVEVTNEEEDFPEHDAFEAAHYEDVNTENQEVPTHTHDFEALNGSSDGLDGGDVNTDGLDDVDEDTEVGYSNDLDGEEVYGNALEGEEEYNDLLKGDDEDYDDMAEYTNTLDDLSGMLDGNGNSPADHNMSDVEGEAEGEINNDSPEM